MLDEVCAAFGGRAAEQITFGKVSTGALSDLEKITKQAYSMVTVYGLNDKIGNISFYDSSGQSEYNFQKPYSEQTAELIDKEVKAYTDMAYKRTLDLLEANKDKLAKVAELLLEREVIFKEDMEVIFGKRPFEDREEELKKAQKLSQEKRDKHEAERKVSEEEAMKEEAESLAKERREHQEKMAQSRAPKNGAKVSEEEKKQPKAEENESDSTSNS